MKNDATDYPEFGYTPRNLAYWIEDHIGPVGNDSVAEVARRLGVNPSSVWRWLPGRPGKKVTTMPYTAWIDLVGKYRD